MIVRKLKLITHFLCKLVK